MLSDDAHQADDADDADSLSEDFAQHVWMCDDSPPAIGASSSSPLTQEVIEYMDGVYWNEDDWTDAEHPLGSYDPAWMELPELFWPPHVSRCSCPLCDLPAYELDHPITPGRCDFCDVPITCDCQCSCVCECGSPERPEYPRFLTYTLPECDELDNMTPNRSALAAIRAFRIRLPVVTVNLVVDGEILDTRQGSIWLEDDNYSAWQASQVSPIVWLRSNEVVERDSRHSTSINLGLAADSVAQPDYDMASKEDDTGVDYRALLQSYDAEDVEYAERYAADTAGADEALADLTCVECSGEPIERHEIVLDARSPCRRLRSFLRALQHVRRTKASRLLEIKRRFCLCWTNPFCRRSTRQKRPPPPPDRARPVNESTTTVSAPSSSTAKTPSEWVWVADSGATVHCVPTASMLTKVTRPGTDRPLKVADKRTVHVECTGTIDECVSTIDPMGKRAVDRLHLKRVLVVPSFKTPLFSCSAGHAHDGISTVLNPADGGIGFLQLPSLNRLLFTDARRYEFRLNYCDDHACQAVAYSTNGDASLAHRRLAHFSNNRLHPSGFASTHDPQSCDACMLNLRRSAYSSKSRAQRHLAPRAIRFGERINSDLLAMPESIGGYRYVIVFVDEASSEAAVRFLRSKEPRAVLEALQSFVAEYEHMLDGGRVATWHTDKASTGGSSTIQ